MRRDSKLSRVLHVLLHMAQHEGPLTSEQMARSMETNPVVVRRILAGLRDKGYVLSEKGHGGGWSLACDLGTITLHDIYVAIGEPVLIAMSAETESPGCLLEQAVNEVLNRSFRKAEEVLLANLSAVTLDVLLANIRGRQREER